MDACPGSLKEVIEYTRMKKRNLSLLAMINLLLQLTSGVAYVHTQSGQPHGNLHPTNILISPTLTPLISDLFMVSTEQRFLKKDLNSSFVAPECKQTKQPSFASDIYSMGCLILYVLTDGEREVSSDLNFSVIEPEAIALLVKRCCLQDPSVLMSFTFLCVATSIHPDHFERFGDF